MPTALVRSCLPELTGLRDRDPHAGLYLTHSVRIYDQKAAGQGKKDQIDNVVRLSTPKVYQEAFARWESLAQEQGFRRLQGKLEGRLYIGVVRDNALEAGVTVHHTYGMPMIPGSAVKGVCRAQGKAAGLSEQLLGWLFGAGGDAKGNNSEDTKEEAGLISFFDAWWVPSGNEKPFVSEVITPHHQKYYGSDGEEPATDWDSPIPAAQIAVRGSFLFTWDGPEKEALLVERLLQAALTQKGIGSKRSSGYGLFDKEDMEEDSKRQLKAAAEKAQLAAKLLKEKQAAAAQLEHEQALAAASPQMREMVADGYDGLPDAFKGKIKGWLDRMEKNEEESAEIANLLAAWWKKNAPGEWEKLSSASKKSQEHLQRLRKVLNR